MEQHAYFEKLSDLAKRAQEPFQAIAKLNVETLQSLNYFKPDELSKIKRPEELVEKQIEIAVANGHKALDYLQKSFQIIEHALLSVTQAANTKNKVEEKQKEKA